MHPHQRLGLMLGLTRRGGRPGERRGLADQTLELGIVRQVVDRLEFAELAHGVGVRFTAAKLLSSPEIERGMRFESRGNGDDFSVNQVGGHAPFDGFVDVGERCMGALPDLVKDRPCKRLSLGDVGVNTRIAVHRMPCPRMSRRTATRITNKLRFRPALPREIMPMPAPKMARTRTSHSPIPSSGMNAMRAEMSATAPMISETRLNIVLAIASFRRLRQPGREQES